MDIRDRKISAPTLIRDDVAAADTGNVSASTSAVKLTTSLHVICIAEFSNASATASIALALFDKSKAFYGIAEAQTLTADASWRNGAAGPYVAPAAIFDAMGAAYVYPIVKSLSAGTVDIKLAELNLE